MKMQAMANHRMFIGSGGGKICLAREEHEGIIFDNGDVP